MNIQLTMPPQKKIPRCWIIIPAAGIGSRMQSSIPKQYLELLERPLIEHSLLTFLEMKWVTGIVVALAPDDQCWKDLSVSNHEKITVVQGGKERVNSVWNAMLEIQDQLDENDYIMVHDAARPCVTSEDLQRLYDAMSTTDVGVLLADKLSDTIKRDDGSFAILKTVPREGLWRALTPQVFPNGILFKALKQAMNSTTISITDEASAVEQLGLSPLLIQGRHDNVKVTTAGDISLAALILQAQQTELSENS